MFGLNRKRFSALAIWVVENVLAAFGCGPLTGKVSVIFQLCVPLNCCVDNDPIVLPAPVDNRLNPNCEIAERSTSAKRTCSRISPVCGGGTSIMLVTLGAAPLTTSKILSATTDDEILPVIMPTSFDVSMGTFSAGKTS